MRHAGIGQITVLVAHAVILLAHFGRAIDRAAAADYHQSGKQQALPDTIATHRLILQNLIAVDKQFRCPQ